MAKKRLRPKNAPKPRKALTAKQAAFCRWYVSGECNLNGAQAARMAGYSGNDHAMTVVASRLLANVSVRAEVDKRLKEAMKGADVTVEGVLRRVQVIGDKSLAAGQYASAAKCAELHGKYLKLWTERIEHVQTIEDVSTAELVRLLREIAEGGGIDLLRLLEGDGGDIGLLPDTPGSPTTH